MGYACQTVLFENAEVDNIAVAEGYRREGIAKKLLEMLEEEAKARGATVMLLEVRVSNVPRDESVSTFGLGGIYTRSRILADGEDAVVMQKRLCGA